MTFFKRDTSVLKDTEFDVVIVGGGISGAWIALHCAELGIKTALIEQGDFASKTSSASSKLLHGGIRYLQQMQFDKVRESAFERAHYLYAAPHASVTVPFAVPTYKDFKRSKLFLNCGMLAYRILCLGENRIIQNRYPALPAIKSISKNELNSIYEQSTTGHSGAVVFNECHMYDSERMVLDILKTAQQKGALVFNYLEAKSLIKQADTVVGLVACDKLNDLKFNIKAKLVINATGPWIDNLNIDDSASDQVKPSITGFAIGSHIITREQLSDHAIAITTKHKSNAKIDRGGRHVFIIPWRGHSLIGTSYNEIDSANQEIKLEADHVEQLLEAVNDAFPDAKLSSRDLLSGYSGLYPLKTDNIQSSVYQGSGEYQIIDHAETQNINGLVTALGAKYTTGRILSAKAMRLVTNKLLNNEQKVEQVTLHNSQYTTVDDFFAKKETQYSAQFDSKTLRHLLINYGSEIDSFIEFIAGNAHYSKPITAEQPDLLGQVAWAVEHEMAITLADVLYRRTSVGHLGINDAEINNVAQLMGKLLQWNAAQTQTQIDDVMVQRKDVKTAFANC